MKYWCTLVIILTIVVGCRSNINQDYRTNASGKRGSPVVIPDKRSNDSENVDKLKIEPSQPRDLSIQAPDPIDGMRDIDLRSLNHITVIELACGYYHDAFGEMPLNPVDLLDGFLLIWPGNVHNDKKPIRMLDTFPNPSLDSDIGNIYYERLNDHEANIHYLKLDVLASVEDSVWKNVKIKVFSRSASYLHNEGKEHLSPTQELGKLISTYPAEERQKFGFFSSLKFCLSFMLADALRYRHILDDTFTELLIEGGYYVSEPTLESLKQAVANDDVLFYLGKYKDDIHAFSLTGSPKNQIEWECRRFDPTGNAFGQIEYHLPCPGDKEAVYIFSSEDIQSVDIPDNLMITKDDIS